MTWEEWYLKKKIDSLKNEKTMKRRMQAKWDEDQKAGNRKNYTEEEKNNFLMEWMNKKKKQRIECERKLKILLEEKKGKVKLKLCCTSARVVFNPYPSKAKKCLFYCNG